MKHNQSGFSIIEVIISFGVLALIGIGFATFSENNIKIKKSIDANFEVVDFVGQVRLILSHPRACLLTLNGLPASSSSNIGIDKIKGSSVQYTNPISWSDYIYKSVPGKLTPVSNITLTSLEIKYPPTFNGEVELVMKLTKSDNAKSGGELLTRIIPLTIEADSSSPAKIGKCFASGAQVSNWSSMCATMGGTSDPLSGKCRGLFKISYASETTPNGTHQEKLIYDGSGEVKIVIIP